MEKESLERIDNFVYKFLEAHVDRMPMRFVKLIANYYTDARIRKLYYRRLHIFMDEGTFSNLGLFSTATEEAPVIIGKNVSIAPNVSLISDSAPNNSMTLSANRYVSEHLIKAQKIVIEDDVWIGSGVTILPGVTVHARCVIGAGAVILEDCEPDSIYAGVPAKKIRSLV